MPVHFPRLVASCAVALAACSQSGEPQPNKVPPAARIEAPNPPEVPSGQAEIDPALKERLARQEAAARMFEKNVLQPQPPKPAIPEPPKPEPARAQPNQEAKPEVKPAQRPEPAKPAARETRQEPPAAAASRASTPAKPDAGAPQRTDLAAAKPSSVPSAPAAARLITRVDPDFPREAVQAGVEKGNVKARMTLDESGAVTRVEVVESSPRRVFDRAVVRALTQWHFNEGTAGRTVETEVDFRR
jgi:TonB family protein